MSSGKQPANNRILTAILNAVYIANKSAIAGIVSPLIRTSTSSTSLSCSTSTSCQLAKINSACLNKHTCYFNNDNKLLHQIGTNLVDLSVCWHKMSVQNTNEMNTQDQVSENTDNLIEKINPIVDQFQTDQLTRRNFEEEFNSLIIKSTFDLTGFDASGLLQANKNQSPGKLAEQIQFLNSSSVSAPNKDLMEQIRVFNKYNQSKYTELTYELLNDGKDLKVEGLIKIYWNLKNPIKLSTQMASIASQDSGYDKRNSFKATSIRDLNKKKKQQISFDDSYSKADEKVAQNIFRSQTVKSKPTTKRPTVLDQDDLEDKKENKENSESDQMFVPNYGSMSSICLDNKTTCLKAIKILLEKFQIENSPDDYSLYKVYQSGDIRELRNDDFPLIQRVLMGPFHEDKLFIMEKGRNLNVNQDITNLICLPEALLKGLLDNSKKEEQKEIKLLKEKFKVYADTLKSRLKKL